MAIIKLITCGIKTGRKEQFSRAQQAWNELSHCEGFEGQLGGWVKDEEAIILGLWKSEESVARFMDSTHDRIYAKAKQSETLSQCTVQYFDNVLNIPRLSRSEVPSQSCILRIVQCENVQNVDRFMLEQKSLWNPAMGKPEGMIGGFVARNLAQSNHFLVVTRWMRSMYHENYSSTAPSIDRQVAPETYIPKLSAYVVHEERSWEVAPHKSLS